MNINNNYAELIQILNTRIHKFKNAMETGLAKPDRFEDLKGSIYSSSLNIAIAQYSLGASKEVVTQSVYNCVPAFEEGFQFNHGFGDYDDMVWLLSLAVLCDIDEAHFTRIVNVLQRDNANDRLIEKLIHYKLPNERLRGYGNNYIQREPYSHLDSLVIGYDKSTTYIKQYLDKKWYQGHSDAAWHNTHLNTKVNCFAGYWAWEVAALAKIYGIDDTSLQNQKYYPYRAVHW